MEQEEKDIELIEAYFDGTLEQDDLVYFEKRRAEDADFDSKVDDYGQIIKEIRAFGKQDFADKLKTWETEIASKKEAKVIPMKRLLSIAAAVIIILVPLAYLLLSNVFDHSNQELFTAYFEPYQDVISERSAEMGALEQGLSAYNQSNFPSAISQLEIYLAAHPDEQGAKCYLGISYLASQQPDKAESMLKPVAEHSSGLFKEVAEWYLALAYLQQDQKEKARDQLRKIASQPDHIFGTRASQLLGEF